MTSSERPSDPGSVVSRWLKAVRRHPVISVTVIACTLAGALLGVYFLPATWGVGRRVLAGAVGGLGTGILVTATRMLGY